MIEPPCAGLISSRLCDEPVVDLRSCESRFDWQGRRLVSQYVNRGRYAHDIERVVAGHVT